jgi:hypothetical protein
MRQLNERESSKDVVPISTPRSVSSSRSPAIANGRRLQSVSTVLDEISCSVTSVQWSSKSLVDSLLLDHTHRSSGDPEAVKSLDSLRERRQLHGARGVRTNGART